MGRNIDIQHTDDELEDINPSCMWGIMHAIDYHHWRYNVKRMLPYIKNQGRRAKGRRSPKERALDHASGELQMLTSPVKQCNKEPAPITKRSLKARIKALIADQMHKEGNDKHHGSRSSPSGLQRTYSIHHLEPPFSELCTDWEHPIILVPGNEDTGRSQHQDPTKVNVAEKRDADGEKFNKWTNKNASRNKLKEHTDVLEIFKVNKELFLETSKIADDGIRKLSCTLPASKVTSRLTKSGSFPLGDLSQRRSIGPTKLKHKQSEIWSAPREEKFPIGTQMPVEVLNYSKNLLSRSGPSADNSSGTRLGRALSLILLSTIESDKEGHRDFVVPSKESKQAVQFEGMTGKNKVDSSLPVLGEGSNRQDSSTIGKDFAESSAESTISRDGDESSCRSHERDNVDYRNSTFSHRSSSLNESLDKYASLFENNFGKEVKLHSSKSLRLSNENEIRSGKSAPTLFTRIRSLSQVDDFYSSLQNVVQDDANFVDWLAEETNSCVKCDPQFELEPTDFSTNTEEYAKLDDIQEPGHQNETLERSDGIQPVDISAESGENITGECSARMEFLHEQLTVGESSSYRDQETINLEVTNHKFPEPCPSSASENVFQEEASSFVEFKSAEGLESISDYIDVDSSSSWENGIDRASSSLLSSAPNLENIATPDHMKDLEKNKPDKQDDTELDYVRNLLERSGFTKDAFQWACFSLDQPINPSVFEEMEAYWHQELECSKEDLWNYYYHQLLFELINEELACLYDRSSTYYPKALSSSCHIRPFPTGNHLVEEICSSVSSLMSLKPEQMQSLDSIVDLDLKKNDGWMNLQLESECVALELEDMIFDELLEELVCF